MYGYTKPIKVFGRCYQFLLNAATNHYFYYEDDVVCMSKAIADN